MCKQSQIEDIYLKEKKEQEQECVFAMRGGRHYLGIIEDYDNKVIKLRNHVPNGIYSHPKEICSYPKDVLLYRSELVTIYLE